MFIFWGGGYYTSCTCTTCMKKFKKFIFITIPKPRGIPPSVCSGTSNLENPMQKAEPSLGA